MMVAGTVIDNKTQTSHRTFPTEEDAQFEATTRNDQILNNQVPAGFNPDSVSSRQSFYKNRLTVWKRTMPTNVNLMKIYR